VKNNLQKKTQKTTTKGSQRKYLISGTTKTQQQQQRNKTKDFQNWMFLKTGNHFVKCHIVKNSKKIILSKVLYF
jgi:hypothetical protein